MFASISEQARCNGCWTKRYPDSVLYLLSLYCSQSNTWSNLHWHQSWQLRQLSRFGHILYTSLSRLASALLLYANNASLDFREGNLASIWPICKSHHGNQWWIWAASQVIVSLFRSINGNRRRTELVKSLSFHVLATKRKCAAWESPSSSVIGKGKLTDTSGYWRI